MKKTKKIDGWKENIPEYYIRQYDQDMTKLYILTIAILIVLMLAMIVVYSQTNAIMIEPMEITSIPTVEDVIHEAMNKPMPVAQNIGNFALEEEESTSDTLPLPEGVKGEFKSCMDWKKITDKTSKQWELQQKAYTDEEGFRRVGKYYLVAIGMGYTNTIGDTFTIKIGGETKCYMIGDVKYEGTDPTHRYHLTDGSIVEFIVDDEVMDPVAIKNGDMSVFGFKGAVEEIRQRERVETVHPMWENRNRTASCVRCGEQEEQ